MDASTKNSVWLGIAYLLVVGTLTDQFTIQIVVTNAYARAGHAISGSIGYYCKSLFWLGYFFISFVAPLITTGLGARRTMLVASSIFVFYELSFLYITEWTLYVAAAIAGATAAVHNNALCVFLSQVSAAADDGEKQSATFWLILSFSLVLSAPFLYMVLHHADEIQVNQVRLIYGVFTGVTLLGVLVIIFCLSKAPDSDHRRNEYERIPEIRQKDNMLHSQYTEPEPESESIPKPWHHVLFEYACRLFRLHGRREMLLLFPFLIFVGFECHVTSALYPTAIGFTKKLNMSGPGIIAMSNALRGTAAMTGAIMMRRWLSLKHRKHVCLVLAVAFLTNSFLMLINLPQNSTVDQTDDIGLIQPSGKLALLSGALTGLIDATTNCLSLSLLIRLYPGNNAAIAFTWATIYQTLTGSVASYASSTVFLAWQLCAGAVICIIATICVLILDSHVKRSDILRDAS